MRHLPDSVQLSLLIHSVKELADFDACRLIFPEIGNKSFSSTHQSQNYVAVDVRHQLKRCNLTTHLFRGWNEAETTGASNRIVACRCIGSHFDAKSQTITFQSLDDVKTQREFIDQLPYENVKKEKDLREG